MHASLPVYPRSWNNPRLTGPGIFNDPLAVIRYHATKPDINDAPAAENLDVRSLDCYASQTSNFRSQ